MLWQRHNEFRFVIEDDRVKLCEREKRGKCLENLHVTEAGFAAALEKIMAMG